MTLKELRNRPIQELPDRPEPGIYYYLDKSFGEDKNYHMYFYYEDGTYDILDYEDGIYELTEKEYLNNMRKSLSEIVIITLLDQIIYCNIEDTKDMNIINLVQVLSETRSISLDDRLFLKDLLKDGILDTF